MDFILMVCKIRASFHMSWHQRGYLPSSYPATALWFYKWLWFLTLGESFLTLLVSCRFLGIFTSPTHPLLQNAFFFLLQSKSDGFKDEALAKAKSFRGSEAHFRSCVLFNLWKLKTVGMKSWSGSSHIVNMRAYTSLNIELSAAGRARRGREGNGVGDVNWPLVMAAVSSGPWNYHL